MSEGESGNDWKSSLVENTPLAFTVVGLGLVVLGAAGGWKDHGLTIDGTPWRITIIAIGIITAVAGTWLYLYGRRSNEVDAEKYQIKILLPKDGDAVSGKFSVSGTYKTKPRAGLDVWVFELSPNSFKYWPKQKVMCKDGIPPRWETVEFRIWGANAEPRILVVALVGKAGQTLIKYHKAAMDEMGKLPGKPGAPGLEALTPDIMECDRITVKASNTSAS